jgi:hypothetical protein
MIRFAPDAKCTSPLDVPAERMAEAVISHEWTEQGFYLPRKRHP